LYEYSDILSVSPQLSYNRAGAVAAALYPYQIYINILFDGPAIRRLRRRQIRFSPAVLLPDENIKTIIKA